MSAAFQLTTQATEDVDGIWWFIAEGSRKAADPVEREIIATCRRLAGYPLIGHHRRESRLCWCVSELSPSKQDLERF